MKLVQEFTLDDIDEITGNTLTFAPKANTEARPNHLSIASLVITTDSNPPDPEWKLSSSGARYLISIESIS